ncbi:MAG: hypothetical protein ACD_24C00417G0002 [uncultured bacterium]|nr:MAG: hypothetical protein ACD_24C00417G0002 [uncultured bacterium]
MDLNLYILNSFPPCPILSGVSAKIGPAESSLIRREVSKITGAKTISNKTEAKISIILFVTRYMSFIVSEYYKYSFHFFSLIFCTILRTS